MNSQNDTSKRKIVAQNRKARHLYFIEEVVEAGLILFGSEVKSLRSGQASIAESYAGFDHGVLKLINAFIPEYKQAGNYVQHDPKRPRELLLHKRQRNKFFAAVKEKGITLVPLSIYFNEKGKAKLELGLAKGKKLHDKRETEKARDWQREKQRVIKDFNH